MRQEGPQPLPPVSAARRFQTRPAGCYVSLLPTMPSAGHYTVLYAMFVGANPQVPVGAQRQLRHACGRLHGEQHEEGEGLHDEDEPA